MSQRVVGYEGEGRHRRPIYADEGPSSAAIALSPVDSIGQLNASSVRGIGERLTGGAGKVERSQATAAQREAWAAADGAETPRRPTTAVIDPHAVMAASRARGGQRTAAVYADRRTATQLEEEPAVVDPAQDPEPVASTEVKPLRELAYAAQKADEAWEELQATRAVLEARERDWSRAREALVEWWEQAHVGGTLSIGHPTPHDDEPELLSTAEILTAAGIEVLPLPYKADDPLTEVEEDALTRQALLVEDDVDRTEPADIPANIPGPTEPGPTVLTVHEQRVLDAVLAADGDRRVAQRALGMKHPQGVDQALEKAARKGALPIDLIPKLPARFARYTSV